MSRQLTDLLQRVRNTGIRIFHPEAPLETLSGVVDGGGFLVDLIGVVVVSRSITGRCLMRLTAVAVPERKLRFSGVRVGQPVGGGVLREEGGRCRFMRKV